MATDQTAPYTHQTPSPEAVKAACSQFDTENSVAEEAMRELFALFPHNDKQSHVLLKVVTLNRLYSTQIFAVATVAQHIYRNRSAIDPAMCAGSPDIVDKIARVTVKDKVRTFFSFATKYCSWHNQDSYPIYDSRVEEFLWKLNKQERFAGDLFARREHLWEYPRFAQIMTAFRSHYNLNAFSYKELDKFIWMQGEPSTLALPTIE